MENVFYLLAAVNMAADTALLALIALRQLPGRAGLKREKEGEEERERDRREREWNEGFASLMGYNVERAKGSVRDDT